MTRKITLYPNTFLWIKGKNGILYDAKHFKSSEFTIDEDIRSICDGLQNLDNLYSVLFDDSSISEEAASFIKLIEDKCFGAVTEINDNHMSLPPLLNVQHKEAKLSYVSAITLYLGGECDDNGYYRQALYPYHSKNKLDVNTVSKFVHGIGPEYIKCINIVVSNVLDMGYALEVVKSLQDVTDNIILHIPLSDDRKEECSKLVKIEGVKSVFICHPDKVSVKTVKECSGIGCCNLILRNDDEYRKWNELIESCNFEDYELIPIFENNPGFFEENVFLNQEDLKNIKLTKREIFSHQALNANFFGDLTVLPDGSVYANVNYPSLGTIKDSIYDLIDKAMEKGQAWLSLRDGKPCSD